LERIIFGHWSTLGYLAEDNVWALDTGCLWGGSLTALRLDEERPTPIHLPCGGQADPTRYV
jgi:bis(5'-nucleosyl)-tetraphosphatase (symmetrical)